MSSAATWSGAEFVQRSEGVETAQQLAVHEIEERARAFGERVIGVDVGLSIREGADGAMASMRAIGTAVRRFRSHEDAQPPDVMLRLNDDPAKTTIR
jgi:uncharacterized protein YbjQ (UPF0145 family)